MSSPFGFGVSQLRLQAAAKVIARAGRRAKRRRLNVWASELEDLLAETGCHLARLVEGEPPEYFAVLEKDESDE
jgi:hypothetical protein